FIIISLWGIYLFKMINLKRIVIGAIGSALIFFMVSNLGVWLNGNLYASSFSGLINCYINALPFFKNSLLGDLVYTTILFGVFELAQMKLGVTNSATVSKN
ncbi:MAG: hypothetical protein ORN85_08845, partial [Sediminibacterium sp.]|nr:hypothetical protein [Sediminibacterium sp.]